MKRPSGLGGLRHLALIMPNLEECERFYVDVIGMEVLRRASDDLVYLTNGNDNLSLGRLRPEANRNNQFLDHFGFVVKSKQELAEWYAFMLCTEAEVISEPHEHTDGAMSFHCKDPAGNIVQMLFHPCFTPWQDSISA